MTTNARIGTKILEIQATIKIGTGSVRGLGGKENK
jgi:hypothetical protein